MSESKYIGRGEELAKKILAKLLKPVNIRPQVPLESITLPKEFAILDPEIKKHKFDFVFFCLNRRNIVVEINYKHGTKAAIKWHRVFIPLLVNAGFDYLTINDYDCRKKGLFWLDSNKQHEDISWDDFRDVIDALETSGITPAIKPHSHSYDTVGGSLSRW